MDRAAGCRRDAEASALGRLGIAEQLVIFLLRLRCAGPEHEGAIACALRVVCGLARVEQALDALDGLVRALDRCGRRPLRLHGPTHDAISADERALLTLVAAHQAGHDDLAAALAAWLVTAQGQPALAEEAGRFARAIATGADDLPLPPMPGPRVDRAPARCRAPLAAVVK
jgi:hypothetical protein